MTNHTEKILDAYAHILYRMTKLNYARCDAFRLAAERFDLNAGDMRTIGELMENPKLIRELP